uniref:Macrophage mannose receptor 1-like n=1 Tax=Pogona vitticeps TaxID=103695 RepID=A0ABM5GNF2_9SAUR
MSAFLLLNLVLLIQPAFQILDSDSFLIYNENLGLCLQLQQSRSLNLEKCNKENERQNFKWVSDYQILNMAEKLCLAVPSKGNQLPVTLSPCNETSGLQKWTCRNETHLALTEEEEEEEDLFLHPADDQKGNVIISKRSSTKSIWKIYGTSNGLCSKGYEALFTIKGNSFGAPCVFPFKYKNQWHATCISDDDRNARLWCGTTSDVDTDFSVGFCPVKGDHDEFFWTRNQWTGDLYQINSDSALTWFQARKSCQQQNADLLSIKELHEQTYLTGLTSSVDTDYWIGLNSLDLDSGWEWISKHPLRYLNWSPGSPSLETAKICGSMQSKNGRWMNNMCDQKFGYICKKENSSLDEPVIPTDGLKPIKCPDGWVAYAQHCYHLNRNPKTWKGALSACRRSGGDLISIHSIEEYSFAISQLDYKTTDILWIGLNDQKSPMYFEWSDGSRMRFTKWQRGEPTHINNVQEDCVIMSGENGYWADYYCEEELGYICKREPLRYLPEEDETVDPTCQKGWKRHGFYCYLIGKTSVTFSEAKTFCEANKGSLTSVENRYEQAYLTSLVGLRSEKYFWIGLSDVAKPGTFNWTNGEKVMFTHWNTDMPGQHSGCVAMRTGTAAGLWDVANCEEKAAFLCRHWAEGVTPPPVPPPTTPPPCPEGWSASTTRNVCFKAFTEEKYKAKTWFEARDFCREIGGDLISIHSIEEQSLLAKGNHKKYPWIGLNSLDPDEGFRWSDGSPMDFENQYFWRAVSTKHDKECATLGWSHRIWIYYPCDYMFHWVCQIKRGVPLKPEPSNTLEYSYKIIEDGWIAYESNEYYFSNITLSAERAQKFCKTHGGGLALIENESENNFLRKYNFFYRARHDRYIGLLLGFDRKFSWIDGSPVIYTAWAPDEPNFANDDENCVVMYAKTGLWNDINCGTQQYFVCERHNRSVRSTVAPTSPPPQGGCADGWLFFDNKCFQIFGFNEEERKNWTAARTDCKNQDGNLATIPNKAVQAFLTMHLKSVSADTWIGLNDIASERTFVWTDGSGVYYTNWGNGFPIHHYFYGSDDCVSMMKQPELQAGNWRDGPCEVQKSYICQRNTDPALSHSETTIPASQYTRYGNSSYSVLGPRMTWEEARQKCKFEHSELASILNPYIQSFLWLQVLKYGEPVWIGLNSNRTGEVYKWISNWRLVYTNWAAEEPREKIACVYLDRDGHWKTGNCSETHFSICEQYHGEIPTETPEVPGRCPTSKETLRSWIPFRAYCYTIYTVKVSWPAASMKCAQLGGTLTSIEDVAELKFLLEHTQQLNAMDFWIGLFRNVDGEWKWEDNSEVDYINWKDGQAGIPVERSYYQDSGFGFQDHCTSMNGYKGEWSSGSCNLHWGFICKTKKIIDKPTEEPRTDKNHGNIRASAHGTIVVVVILVTLVLVGASVATYMFYKRRSKQQQTTGGFNNALYGDNVVILHNH